VRCQCANVVWFDLVYSIIQRQIRLYLRTHDLLICDALGLDHAWYAAPSVHKIDQFSQSP
jgi:hypothetical protein